MQRWSSGLLLLLVLITLSAMFRPDPQDLLNPLGRETLKSVSQESMIDTKGRYGIFIKNLKTGESYTLAEHEKFHSASLYKLWVMGTVFEEIKKGNLSEIEVLSDDIANLNRKFSLSKEEAELTEGTIKQTVTLALEQMITISHNYSALLLSSKVGERKMQEFLKKYSFNQSSLDPLETTPSDIGLFFELLYEGKIVDGESSKKMLELLSRQKINDRIPKLLPTGVRVAHKTGDIGLYENDGGIVFSPAGDYIFVALSQSDVPKAAGERIAELSKAVFDYFN